MVAQELRIGNLLMELTSDDVFSVTDRYFSMIDINIECCRPIPITQEWLLKFGIIIETGYNESGLEMVYLSDKYYDLEFSFIELKSVHQVQNLYFALTQKELTL